MSTNTRVFRVDLSGILQIRRLRFKKKTEVSNTATEERSDEDVTDPVPDMCLNGVVFADLSYKTGRI